MSRAEMLRDLLKHTVIDFKTVGADGKERITSRFSVDPGGNLVVSNNGYPGYQDYGVLAGDVPKLILWLQETFGEGR